MSGCLHLVSNGAPGFLVPDRKCLQRSVTSKIFFDHASNHRSLVCNLNSNNNRRRNPDFSRQQKGPSRGKNRPFQERETHESPEQDPASKNGSLFSLSGSNQRGQATAKPGQREKEIVELFRKVQAQLRARAAVKEEKKTDTTFQGQQGERGTVDSLLKLLRKHSVDQDEKGSEEDFNLDQPVESSSKIPEEVGEPDAVVPSRPVSSFRRRSPVPRVKFQPVFSAEEDGSSTSSFTAQVESAVDEQDLEAEPFEGTHDIFPADASDASDVEELFEESKELAGVGSVDLSAMKLSELRGVAKSQGLKGFSKLKKAELVELLSSLA